MGKGLIIDVDAHVYEPGGMWARYIDKEYRDEAPKTVYDNRNRQRLMVEGRVYPQPEGKGIGVLKGFYEALSPRVVFDEKSNRRFGPEEQLDVKYIVEDMDREGFDVMTFFPAEGLCVFPVQNPGLAVAMARAYNNWVSEYLGTYPSRLWGMAVVPLQDSKEAAAELKRAVQDLGLVGGVIPSNLHGQRNLDDPVFDPIYETAQALDTPLMVHDGSGITAMAGTERYDNWFFNRSFCQAIEKVLALHSIVGGGVLEKFPKLRVVFLEAGCGWVPYWLQRLDETAEKLHFLAPWLKLTPTEYFSRQCFVSCDPEERTLPDALRHGLEDTILFASDYPHFDSEFPSSRKGLEGREDVSDRAKAKIFGENAVRLFSERTFSKLRR